MFFSKLKDLFKKEKTYSCIIWDTKTMNYRDLTKKKIDEINDGPKYEGWKVSIKDEC